jgi:hypothetical protein
LSVDAVQEVAIDVAVFAPAASPEGAVGAEVSGHGSVETVIEAGVEAFPAASKASTPIVWLVPQTRPVAVNTVEVVVPALAPSRKRW